MRNYWKGFYWGSAVLLETMSVPYTLLFISAVYALTVVVVILDFLQSRMLREVIAREASSRSGLLYLHVFKLLAEAAIIWLIVAFVGQVWMGWIKF